MHETIPLTRVSRRKGTPGVKLFISKAAARLRKKIAGLLQIALSYAIVYWVCRGTACLKLDRHAIQGLTPPFIVLSNHTSNFDPFFVQFAIRQYPCYFLTSNYYFRLPIIGTLLRFFGAIPKIQFSPDIRSTRGTLEAIARGDVVGIFPEGRRSIDGSCCNIADSITKLIKKTKVPVISVNIRGAYFVWPRWSSSWRRGHVEIVAKQLFSPVDIESMETGQMQNIICQALAYNEYDWNRQAGIVYAHKKAAEQLHLILHQCPRCLGAQKMRSKENRLYCTTCGNTALIDNNGFLQPLDEYCRVFDDPVQWTVWQRSIMFSLLYSQGFELYGAVKELRVADKFYGPFRTCGSGHISLRTDGLRFWGQIDHQDTELFFPISMIPTISTEFGYDCEICDKKNAWWIFLEEEQQTVRLECAISLLYQLKHGENTKYYPCC